MSMSYTTCIFCGHSFGYTESADAANNAILVTCPSCHKQFAFEVNAIPLNPDMVFNHPNRAFTADVDAADAVETLAENIEAAEATIETEEIAESQSE